MIQQEERLSVLQLLMRESSALAPYNFIHAMLLPGAARADRWQKAISAAMNELEMLPRPGTLEQASTDLERHLQAELQRPFSVGEAPVRFFISDAAGGHWLGVVLDHWAADDFSCRALMQRLYELYYGVEQQSAGDAQRWQRRATALPRRLAWVEWFRFFHQLRRLRRARRTALSDPLDFSVSTFRRTFPEGALAASKNLARELAVTLHDLFLAGTAQAFGSRNQSANRAGRDAVAIVSAMNARRFAEARDRETFGALLGQYIVIERRPDQLSLAELSQRIARRTRRLKAGPGTELFAPTLSLWRLARSRRAKATFFQRGAPVVAGLSNVNLTGSWIEHAEIEDYRRIGPTGPVVPMVLMITTLHGRILIDVTFRTVAFTADEAKQIVDDIVSRLPG
jgi:hypothetical protein